MGDHDTLYTLLMPEFWARLEGRHAESLGVKEALGREFRWALLQDTHFTLLHVGSAVIAVLFILFCVTRYRASISDKTKGVVPEKRWGLGSMTGNFVGAVYDISVDIMGPERAKKHLPFIATLALFIFCNNIQGLIPGFLPGTDTLKTNLVLSGLVFLAYNFHGLRVNGMQHLAHFMGPSFALGGITFPWLFALMIPVEIASHLGRPVSLAFRLMGNIMADHKVVGVMMFLCPLLIPVPFLLLGTLVSIVQTLVFTLLTVLYIGMATDVHDEHH